MLPTKIVPSKMYQQKFPTTTRIFQQGFFSKDFSTRIFYPCWQILVEKSFLEILVEKSLFQGFSILVEKSLLQILVGNPCWKSLMKNPRIFQQGFYNKDFQQGFATRIFNVPTKMFQQKCSIKNVPTKCSNKNVPTKMFHQKCTNKNVPTKVANKNVPTKIFHQGLFNKEKILVQQWKSLLKNPKMFQQPGMFQQKSCNKNFPSKMFQQKCSNKNVPSKMYQQKCSNKSCQQKSSNKDFPAKIFQQTSYNKATRISNNYVPTGIFQQGFLSWKILVKYLVEKQGFSNKDFSTRIFNPCWKILVEKSLLKNPCCKILVEKSLFKILVGNPCWKIQGFFNKDFSTRNNNKDLQQWFATRIFNVPTKMFHQKCSNKNVPTKVANKNLPTRIFQQGFFNKDLQQGKKDFQQLFQQGFFNKDFLSLLTNFVEKILCWQILVEKSLLQNPCWKILVENPCWKSLLEILVEKSKDFSTRIFQQGITTRICNKDF